MTREEVSKKAVKLMEGNKNVALQWATGVGKSKAALDIIQSLKDKGELSKGVLLCYAEKPHLMNWMNEFRKWDKDGLLALVTPTTYASLKNRTGEEYSLIILDEGHHAGSNLRLDILSLIKSDHVLLLSATLHDVIVQDLERIFGKFVNYKISLKDAVKGGILPEPKIFVIPLELDDYYPIHQVIQTRGASKKRVTVKCTYAERWKYLKDKKNYPNIKLIMSCTAKEKNSFLTEQSDYWYKQFVRVRNEAIKNKWLQIGSERKRFLGECKTDISKVLLRKLKKKRYICFCSSIDQATKLGKDNAIHSERKNSLEIIEKFNNKEINNLFAIGMLQEGQNLEGIEAGIIIQLDGQERGFVQKAGRAMRAESPLVFILYYKGTRDEDYLNNVLLDKVDTQYVKEVEDIYELEV